jgi:hypothetical protein
VTTAIETPQRTARRLRVRHSAALTVALVGIGAAGIVGWLTLAVAHIGDRYLIGHVQGGWMAIARYANEGTLYPPLFDGIRYGGTRWMPLQVLVNAGAARPTGEYLMSGKMVAIALFGVLLLLVFVALRRLRCPWPLAAALTGLLPATATGLLVGSAVGGDVLPVVLQLGALLAVDTSMRRGRLGWVAVAGALAGAAAASKLTGVWAVLAVISWLALRQEWRRLGWFFAIFACSAAVVLGFAQWASEGRFLSVLLTLTFAGTGGPVGWVRAPNQLIQFGIGSTPAVWMVAPFAALGVIAARQYRQVTLFHHALGWSLLLTLIVYTDMGAGLNHLVDLSVLIVLVVGSLAGHLEPERIGGVTLRTALVIAVLWAGATGVREFVPDLREVLATARSGVVPNQYTPGPLAGVVDNPDGLLSEDPTVPLLLGGTPVVLDPFMLRRIDEVQPEAVDALVTRIERREFDHVALMRPLDEEDFWWQHYHFGLRVVEALREAYVFVDQVDGYYVYQPDA